MAGIITAVLMFLYAVVAVAVLYRVLDTWLHSDDVNSLAHIANALNAIVVFVALGILHAVAAAYGVAPPLHVP